MSISHADLLAEVMGNLQLDATVDNTRFNFDDNVNAAQRKLLNMLDQKYLTEAIKTDRGDLSINVPFYQHPAGFYRFLKLWIDYGAEITDLNVGKRANLVGDVDIDINNINRPYSITYPQVSLGVEGGFEIRPIPLANQTKGWRMRYVYALAKISSTQVCLLRANLRNLLVIDTTKRCALVDDFNPELAARYEDIFKEEVTTFLPKKEKRQSG